MTREPARLEWLEVLQRYWRDPVRPVSKEYWSSLDTLSADELHNVQSEKLRAVVRYAYECIPFYRRKFDRVGLNPLDVRSVDDIRTLHGTDPAFDVSKTELVHEG